MAHDAFISYAFEDKVVADALCDKLEAAGISCWIAPRDPRPGLPYGAQIVQAIAQSRIELLVLSRHANESRAVLGEVEVGANRGKIILPLRVEDVQPIDALEYYIRAVHWFDATRPPFDARLNEAVAFVRDCLNEVWPRSPPVASSKNNLPSQVTSFVAREAEATEIVGLLEGHRLVTLTGSAGVGKTRTSLQVAASLLDGFGDGVWLIELAALASGEYLPSTVASTLGLNLAPEGDPLKQLTQALKARQALLVFDNCEHLVAQVGHVVAAILRDCSRVKILTSSRQALGIAGEQTYRLPPLSIPSSLDAEHLPRDVAARYPAIALFAERALAVDRQFALTDENAPIVAEICRRLDGIPLAIELAAARVNILRPRQLRDRLNERFRVLTGGSRDALPRQQTLRALIDWSYDLLDDRERTLFRRLGIFVNGFALEGAVAVGSGEGLDDLDVLDVLGSLVDKSLALAEAAGDALRYRMLESTRVYAREKLVAADELAITAGRHLRYLCDLFVNARTRSAVALEHLLQRELEDVRAALDWAPTGPDALIGGELLAAIWANWGLAGLYAEGEARIEAFLSAQPETEPSLLARLSIVVAILRTDSGRTARGFEAATQALAYARACSDPATLAEALGTYSWSAARLRKFDDAKTALAEAEAIPGLPDRTRRRVLEARANVSGQSGDLASAARALEQLRNEYRSLRIVSSELVMIQNLAEVEHERGESQRAIELLREVLPTLRAERDRVGLVQVLGNLAGYLTAVDDLTGARAAAHEAIEELAEREPEEAHVSVAIEHLALALALDGELPRAAILSAYADIALRRHGYEREFTEQSTHDRLTAILRERLAVDVFEILTAKGAALTPHEAIAEALR